MSKAAYERSEWKKLVDKLDYIASAYIIKDIAAAVQYEIGVWDDLNVSESLYWRSNGVTEPLDWLE
jgi:hypothetical protein